MPKFGKKSESKCEMQMTAMIDVVFQLLIFFMLSFKIVSQEGDFNVKMPLAAPREGLPDENKIPPLKVRLKADGGGGLASLAMNDQPLGGFDDLRNKIIQTFGTNSGPGTNLAAAEVELDCDFDLKYEFVIRAVTAVSGFADKSTGHIVKLVEKIKFAPPRAAGGG